MIVLFYLSLFFLLAIWFIYPIILSLLSYFNSYTEKPENNSSNPSVSVIIAAHNEANNLVKRCKNIFSQNYDGKIEVIIASDGSNDETEAIVEKLKNDHADISLIIINPQGGRSNAHNIAIKKAAHDILIFTDAETVFEDDCILNLVIPFSENKIGFVSGTLKYMNHKDNFVSESVGLYWKYEMFLRKMESIIGLYATGTGACCAVRKILYKKIPATGDVDFITPIDTIIQGCKCIHSDNAIAWDVLPDTPDKELKARIRMTSKNISGTLKRWGIVSIFNLPGYSFAIFFHKIGRWLTPFFLIILLISNLFLFSSHWIYNVSFLIQILFYLLGVLGSFNIKMLYSYQIYSFLLANLGFFLGVLNAILGRVPKIYKPMNKVV